MTVNDGILNYAPHLILSHHPQEVGGVWREGHHGGPQHVIEVCIKIYLLIVVNIPVIVASWFPFSMTCRGRYHSIRATCVVKFWFFCKNHSGPFVHITWYHLIAKKRPKVPLPGAFSFWAFFPKNLQFCKICPDPHILGPTIKCYTISESSRLPRRRATLVIYLVASTNEK